MIGAVSPDSFDTLHSYSNTFQMPFVTPWFPEKVRKTQFFIALKEKNVLNAHPHSHVG